MKKPLLFLLSILIISHFSISQTEIKLDNNLTGILSSNKTTSFGLNFVGSNSIKLNKISVDIATNYAIRFSPTIKENEFIQRQNVGLEKDKWNLFLTHQFNYSLIREIETDNWLGIGGGIKFKYKWGGLSLSYASIYQNSNYINQHSDNLFRHSVRTKIKYENKNISFSSEYFFQPNMVNFNDLIIYGSSTIGLSVNKSLSFIIQDVINWRSESDVQLIHNLSLGMGYKFNKIIKKT